MRDRAARAALLLIVGVYFVMRITQWHAFDFVRKAEVGSPQLAENIGVFDMSIIEGLAGYH